MPEIDKRVHRRMTDEQARLWSYGLQAFAVAAGIFSLFMMLG